MLAAQNNVKDDAFMTELLAGAAEREINPAPAPTKVAGAPAPRATQPAAIASLNPFFDKSANERVFEVEEAHKRLAGVNALIDQEITAYREIAKRLDVLFGQKAELQMHIDKLDLEQIVYMPGGRV